MIYTLDRRMIWQRLAVVLRLSVCAAVSPGVFLSPRVFAQAPTTEVPHALRCDAQAIHKAQEAILAEAAVAAADPYRPIYHFLPEARWMNDPNGAFFADGWYHVFYQLNPYGNQWGHIHWGHARSRDNVMWERLPIAICPSTEKGEHHCYSGSAVQDANGEWQLWYTSVTGAGPDFSVPGRFNGQVMLRPLDKDFIRWGKATDDPVKRPTLRNNIDGFGWGNYLRDPAFFKVGARTFMLLGITGSSDVGGDVAPIYEAKNRELTEWAYRGKMADYAWDCPQMIPFGQKWMYILTRDAPPRYFVGAFDLETARFAKSTDGRLDLSAEYKTVSIATDDRGRRVVYSWIAPTIGKGWNNCFAIPRVLTLGENGHAVQTPIPELKLLRGERTAETGFSGARVLPIRGDALEIDAVFEQADKGRHGLLVRRSQDGTRSLGITYEQGTLDVCGARVGLAPEGPGRTIALQVYLDRSIIEVFANGGKQTVVRLMYPPEEDLGVEAFTDGRGAVVAWRMKSIW